MFCKMTSTTIVRFKKDTKQSFHVLSTTTTVEVQSTKNKFQKLSIFVFCNLYSTRNGYSFWETKYKIQNLSFFFVIFGATLSRRFARQIFTSVLSRKDLTKLKKQKNGFLFFVLVTTRYDRARQSQQKLQFCTLFLYSHKERT